MFRFAIVGLAVVLFGTHASAQDSLQKTLVSQEKKVIDAIKRKDNQALKELLAEEEYTITIDGGRQTGAQILRRLQNVTVAKYSVSDVRSVAVSKDVGILTYKFTWSGSNNGVNVPDTTVLATSTWALRDGRWRAIFYQETPVKQ